MQCNCLVNSPLFLCAFVSHLADTLVVKLAQLWEYMSLVVPVMSSHWAGAVPPAEGLQLFIKSFFFFNQHHLEWTCWVYLYLSVPLQAGHQSVSAFSKQLGRTATSNLAEAEQDCRSRQSSFLQNIDINFRQCFLWNRSEADRTNNTAEEAEASGVSFAGIAYTLPPRWR